MPGACAGSPGPGPSMRNDCTSPAERRLTARYSGFARRRGAPLISCVCRTTQRTISDLFACWRVKDGRNPRWGASAAGLSGRRPPPSDTPNRLDQSCSRSAGSPPGRCGRRPARSIGSPQRCRHPDGHDGAADNLAASQLLIEDAARFDGRHDPRDAQQPQVRVDATSADLLIRTRSSLLQQRDRRHDLSGRAVAALKTLMAANASCTRCSRPSVARSSMLVTSRPSHCAAPTRRVPGRPGSDWGVPGIQRHSPKS